MLGNGPLSGKIKAIFQGAGLLDRVHFPGLVPQDSLPAYYQAADLYISTSHSDGTSISLLEALATGTPVLLRDIPGNREWIEKQPKAGWLFKDGELPAVLERVLQNREGLAEIGAAARLLAEEKGDWDKNFPELEKAWQLALEK